MFLIRIAIWLRNRGWTEAADTVCDFENALGSLGRASRAMRRDRKRRQSLPFVSMPRLEVE